MLALPVFDEACFLLTFESRRSPFPIRPSVCDFRRDPGAASDWRLAPGVVRTTVLPALLVAMVVPANWSHLNQSTSSVTPTYFTTSLRIAVAMILLIVEGQDPCPGHASTVTNDRIRTPTAHRSRTNSQSCILQLTCCFLAVIGGKKNRTGCSNMTVEACNECLLDSFSRTITTISCGIRSGKQT